MKICFISDTHTLHKGLKIPDCDLLVHAGDISSIGTEYQTYDFFNWIISLKNVKRFCMIAGNHDFYFENKALTKEVLNNFPSVAYLENSGVEIDGLKIWGSPITPTFYNWAFMADRGKKIKKHWNQIPENLDILITHGPPKNILDRCPDGFHVGCEDLLEAIRDKKSKIHVFGHIHDGHGQEKIGDTLFINSSVLNEQYKITYEPIVIEL